MVTFILEFVSQEILDWGASLTGRLSGVTSSAEQERIRKEYVVEHPRPKAKLTHVADMFLVDESFWNFDKKFFNS